MLTPVELTPEHALHQRKALEEEEQIRKILESLSLPADTAPLDLEEARWMQRCAKNDFELTEEEANADWELERDHNEGSFLGEVKLRRANAAHEEDVDWQLEKLQDSFFSHSRFHSHRHRLSPELDVVTVWLDTLDLWGCWCSFDIFISHFNALPPNSSSLGRRCRLAFKKNMEANAEWYW